MATTLDKPYTTVDRVKHECRLKQSEDGNDDWLTTCVNDASRIVETFTRRAFRSYVYSDSETLTVLENWIQGGDVFLPWPIVTLGTLYLYDGTSNEEIDSDDYSYENLDEGGYGSVLKFHSWFEAMAAFLEADDMELRITGTFGYTVAEDTDVPSDLPSEILRATTIIAAAISGLNRREVLNYTGDRVSLADSRIPEEAMKLLTRAKRLTL